MQVNPKNKIKQAIFWLMMLYGQRFLAFSFDSLLSKSFYIKTLIAPAARGLWGSLLLHQELKSRRRFKKTRENTLGTEQNIKCICITSMSALSYLHIHNSSEMLRSFERQSIFFVKSNISKWNCWEYFYALFSAVKI